MLLVLDIFLFNKNYSQVNTENTLWNWAALKFLLESLKVAFTPCTNMWSVCLWYVTQIRKNTLKLQYVTSLKTLFCKICRDSRVILIWIHKLRGESLLESSIVSHVFSWEELRRQVGSGRREFILCFPSLHNRTDRCLNANYKHSMCRIRCCQNAIRPARSWSAWNMVMRRNFDHKSRLAFTVVNKVILKQQLRNGSEHLQTATADAKKYQT